MTDDWGGVNPVFQKAQEEEQKAWQPKATAQTWTSEQVKELKRLSPPIVTRLYTDDQWKAMSFLRYQYILEMHRGGDPLIMELKTWEYHLFNDLFTGKVEKPWPKVERNVDISYVLNAVQTYGSLKWAEGRAGGKIDYNELRASFDDVQASIVLLLQQTNQASGKPEPEDAIKILTKAFLRGDAELQKSLVETDLEPCDGCGVIKHHCRCGAPL